METLIFIYLIFFAALAYWKLDWAILLLLFALPSYLIRFDIFNLPFNLLGSMVLICFFIWLVFHTNFLKFLRGGYCFGDLKKNRKERLKYPFGVELVLVLVVSFIAAGVAYFKPEALGSWRAYFFEPTLLFILILNLFQTNKKRRRIIWALALSCLLLSIYAIFQKFTGIGIENEFWRDEATRRVTSVFPYPNALALYLGPLIMLFLGYFGSLAKKITESKIKTVEALFLALVIFLSLLAVLFTGSKGALGALAVGFLVFLFFLGGKLRWFSYGLLIGVLCLLIFSPGPRESVVETVSLKDLSGEIRKKQWRETWEMFENESNFITGSGLHNYQEAIEPYHEPGLFFNKDRDPDFRRKIVIFDDEYKAEHWQPVEIYLYPHNIFLNFWTELGLLGMILFSWIILKFFVWSVKIQKRLKGKKKEEKYLTLGLMGSMIVIVVHGLVDVPYFKNDLAIIFWVFLAILSLIFVKLNKKDFALK